jgi:hypothetical protein
MGRTGGRCCLLKETSPALHTRRCRPDIERERREAWSLCSLGAARALHEGASRGHQMVGPSCSDSVQILFPLTRDTPSKWCRAVRGETSGVIGIPEETDMEDNTLVKSSFSAATHPSRRSIFPPGALACRNRNTSPAPRLTFMRGKSGRDLELEREEDRRQHMRVCQCGAQLLHAGAPGLSGQGIPWEVFQAARKPGLEAHNRQETPLFATSIERHALNTNTAATANA